ncbi:MAG: Fe(3+)-hydroxamate ABC transporter permease FhuB [Pseudomonas sp.]|nr:Fe(3+)-hydroxamate ABC transporter permease FhuB [Pseudomonas sp.]
MRINAFPISSPLFLCLILGAIVVSLAWTALPVERGLMFNLEALFEPVIATPEEAVLYYSWWPRLCISLIAGAGLGLAGVLMQQVLRNPLAAPTTLGVASGANLALIATTLFAPVMLASGREWIALGGGAATMALVFALAWSRGLAPMVVVLAGLVVNLFVGALAITLLLFNQEALKGILVWGAGSLTQSGWDGTAYLWPRLAVCAVLAFLLLRPLAVMDLDESNARSLGVSVRQLRLAGLGLAVFITGCVVSVVGIIGFIGLAAPNIARMAGARRLGPRMLWSMVLGALLLTTTDLVIQYLAGSRSAMLPTGAMTAALGAPLLLWLIPRLRLAGNKPTTAVSGFTHRHARPGRLALTILALLLAVVVLALFLGQTAQGWGWTAQWSILEWRLPRILAAAGAGIMLAIAGTIIQRISGNPMASPELLGISGGSAIALMASIFLLRSPDNVTLITAGTVGALAALAVLVVLNRRSGYIPERLLLTGVAITALFDAVRSIVLSGGDPRGQQVVAWLSGSTYYVDLSSGVFIALVAIVVMAATRPLARWLDILPLGAATASSLGIGLNASRLLLLVLIALLTACATLVIGPLSFVGLLAPHLARLLGFGRAREHMLGAALIGALLMILADWMGRQALFPHEIPAGLVASLIGGAYFIWSMRRR